MTLMILGVWAFVSLIIGIAMKGWPKGAHDGLGIVASILLFVLLVRMAKQNNHLEPLTDQQLMGICDLQQSSQ